MTDHELYPDQEEAQPVDILQVTDTDDIALPTLNIENSPS